MAGRGGRVIDHAWLTEHYPRMTTIDSLLDEHEREFGWRPNKQVIYVKANRMGLHKEPVSGRDGRAERTIRWSREPEMEAWMLEHDHGQRMDELQTEWRERWGFGISRAQVNLFRASHSTQTRKNHGGGRKRKPIGSEYPSKDGYIVVKVREEPTVPMSKDNWVFKHVWVWEQEHGPLPEDHVVFFADGDKRNFDPGNLVAVPRRLVGILNNASSPKWHDAESLEACVAMAKIEARQSEIYAKAPRACGVCGRVFVPDERHVSTGATRIRTCPECLAAGREGRRQTQEGEGMTEDLCNQCESCRWWRVMRGECSQRTPAISWSEHGRVCEDYQRAVGEDWHAMLYGNSDTRRMHQ